MTEQLLTCGLLNWYPFKRGAGITFIGECTEEFKQDILRRGVIEKATPPFDYIIAVRALEEDANPAELLKSLKGKLAAGGHIFLACENRFGLPYFAGEHDPYTERVMDGIENYPGMSQQNLKGTKGRCYARYEIEGFLQAAGFDNYRGYSILPGLLMPQQLYHWDYLPEENLEIRYTALYQHPESIFMDVAKVYDGLVKNDMFHQMAGAYLIDCCESDDCFEVKHVTTSMDRGKENATATIICKSSNDDKNDVVYKYALYPEGSDRIEKLLDNMDKLRQQNVPTVPIYASSSDGAVRTYGGIELSGCRMPYISAPTGVQYLRELAYRDKEEFIRKTCQFLDFILQSSHEVPADETDELAPLYECAYLDMVPLNSFYTDDTFVFFDQEFCERNYPVGVVLARALTIIYVGDKRLEEIVPKSYFIDRYGLERKFDIYTAKGDKYIQNLRNRQKLVTYNSRHMLDYVTVEVNKQRITYSSHEYQRLFIDIMKDIAGKHIFVFGSGLWAKKFIAEYADSVTIEALLDNNESVWGQSVDGVKVASPDILKSMDPDSYKVFICIKQYSVVLNQIIAAGAKNYGIYNPNIERPAIRSITTSDHEKVQSSGKKKYHTGYVAGVFDLFHIGHLNLLRRAKEQCEHLIVGVVSDEQACGGKEHAPYVPQAERLEIVQSCRYVDEAFILPPKASGTRDVYRKYHFDVQFSGSDYENDPYWLTEQAWLKEHGADLVFFPYTQSTSSTKLKDAIRRR